MQIFTNILIAVLVVLFSFVGSKNLNKIYILSFIVLIFLIIIPLHFYAETLSSASSWFPRNSNIHFKLTETAKFLEGNYSNSDITGRADRYPLLINEFLANPILGNLVNGPYKDIYQGYHLYWMNKLTIYGILGTLPFLFILYSYIKNNIKYFDREFVFYFILSIASILVLGLMKVIIGREIWFTFFIIIPGLYYLQILKNSEKRLGKPINYIN